MNRSKRDKTIKSGKGSVTNKAVKTKELKTAFKPNVYKKRNAF